VLGEHRVEAEEPGDLRAAPARDDVGADAAELTLGQVGIALVEGGRDGEAEDAVAEELEPLVGGGAIRRRRRMRQRLRGLFG